MKRLLFTIMGILMLVAAHATGFETINGLRYLINTDNHTATLIPNTVKYSGDIVVPENVTIAGIKYTVVTFYGNCFKDCSDLTSVSIPSTVTSLGPNCFYGCNSIKTIKIPSSVTSLGDYCFYGCSSLTSITIPSSVTSLGPSCFNGCSSLTSITIPSSVTNLGRSCFNGCCSLTSITIPSSVTSLGASCFSRCSSLTSITIPSSVTSLGASCFSRCSSLTSITIPSSVTSLGQGCFSGCSSLTSITIPSSVTSLEENCFSGCSSLTSITIPSSVTSLGQSCFSDCSSLKSITIPASVTSIGYNCFGNCISLPSITFPSSVQEIDWRCCYNCDSLKTVYFNSTKVPAIVGWLFEYDPFHHFSTRKNIYVPAGSIEDYKKAFPDDSIYPINSITEKENKGKCVKPNIINSDWGLILSSPTEGAEYHYTIDCSDVESIASANENGDINLTAAYKITAFATADDYLASDTTTATLYWVDGNLETNSSNTAKKRGVLASFEDGIVNISGLTNGETVALYTVDGKLIGEARAVNGVASYAVSNMPVVIAKIDGQSIKIAVQ